MGTTKKDLIDRIAERSGDTHALVKAVIQSFFQEITAELAQGNRLEFRDFGVFAAKATPARKAQNPRTGEKVHVSAGRRVVFKPGKQMRDGLNDAGHMPNPAVRSAGMSGPPDERDIVSLLAEHEQAVRRLYRTYAGRFPQCRDFWSGLAEEEDQHARWLRRLLVRVEEGLGCVRPNRFDSSAVKASIQRIEQMVGQAEKPDYSPAEALSTAMTLEETLLECRYFEVFEGTAAEVVQVQYCLADAIEDHCRRLQEMMASGG